MIEVFYGLICFFVFVVLQALFINGLKASMDEGMILENYLKWVKMNFSEFWQKPFGTCIRCLSSTGGFITYWPIALSIFGYKHWMIPVFVADVFILVSVSFFIYKKL
jgi:hypothetical protein